MNGDDRLHYLVMFTIGLGAVIVLYHHPDLSLPVGAAVSLVALVWVMVNHD